MNGRPRRLLALGLLFGLCAAARAAAPRAAILGTWRGTSTCVKSPEFPACHDEVVVYESKESSSGDEITGTLVDLPSKHLIRNVAVKREKS